MRLLLERNSGCCCIK